MRGKDAIILLGKTDTAKSTLIQAIAGIENQEQPQTAGKAVLDVELMSSIL